MGRGLGGGGLGGGWGGRDMQPWDQNTHTFCQALVSPSPRGAWNPLVGSDAQSPPGRGDSDPLGLAGSDPAVLPLVRTEPLKTRAPPRWWLWDWCVWAFTLWKCTRWRDKPLG